MKRRGFLAALAALPFIGRLVPADITMFRPSLYAAANGVSYKCVEGVHLRRLVDRWAPPGCCFIMAAPDGGKPLALMDTSDKPPWNVSSILGPVKREWLVELGVTHG